MTTHEHLLSAEAQLLMADMRQVTEPCNPRRAQNLKLAQKYLEEAIRAGAQEEERLPFAETQRND